MRVDVDDVDRLQGGEVPRAEVVGDQRAVHALGDVRVAADGDDQQVAERAGVLKVVDVAGVNDVEAAVAVDDGVAGGAGLHREGRAVGRGRADLACRCHASRSMSTNRALVQLIGRERHLFSNHRTRFRQQPCHRHGSIRPIKGQCPNGDRCARQRRID